jgi:predicted NodU family carbamoyl transferase
MKILGINISHDSSIAGVEDGVPIFCHDEARFRREKYWTPTNEDVEFESIVRKIDVDEYDEVVFATFDRRTIDFKVKKEVLAWDKLKSREFLADVRAQQLSQTRCEELQEKYGKDLFSWSRINLSADRRIANKIAKIQLERSSADIILDHHHIYHAYCGYRLSPFFEKGEDAIAITWDGGGSNALWDEYPGYQEIESIYRCTPDTLATLQWQRLSNQRVVDHWSHDSFPNELQDCTWAEKDEEATIDGVDYVFTSDPSMGMNFSQMSAALGCDEHGRAAGKVMGMASYDLGNRPKVFTQHTVTQQLEQVSLEHSCDIIQNAIDRNPDVKNIVLSGGYSLNCTNNYKYLQRFPDHQFFVDPMPHDGGTAMGAALYVYEQKMKEGVENGED